LSTGRSGSSAPRSGHPRAQLPLLDRLLDARPGVADVSVPTAAEALERLRSAVRRDVEALLNARRRRRPLPKLLTQLPTSLLNYGAPDPVSGTYAIPELRAALAAEVEATIRRFEPRLSSVTVELLGEDDVLSGVLRMKVDAVLRADPVPEPVSFETRVEPVSRDVTVREA
jgi:type VI secretion system protein ImpF